MMPPSSARTSGKTGGRQSVDFQWAIQHYIPEDGILHNHCCENLESYMENFNLVLFNMI
jgi:hypothetical protein